MQIFIMDLLWKIKIVRLSFCLHILHFSSRKCAQIAQSVEREAFNLKAGGSSPPLGVILQFPLFVKNKFYFHFLFCELLFISTIFTFFIFFTINSASLPCENWSSNCQPVLLTFLSCLQSLVRLVVNRPVLF